ncbi:MAG: carbohydrate ABC transporter permease [Elusimicrobiota bacterium]
MNKIKKIIEKYKINKYIFVAPAAIMFLVFGAYPFFRIFQLSIVQWDGIASAMDFVGLSNFRHILFSNPVWWQSVKNAGYITLLALIFQNGVALLFAYIVDKDIKAKNFYRTIFFLPPILSGIAVGIIWNWILQGDYGLLNQFLQRLNLSAITTSWLSNPDTALTSVAVIHMWRGMGWGFLILLAGLQSIPRDVYEAARIDGANEFKIFTKVTMPLMIPTFFIVSILTILGTMQVFDIIVATTQGGPGYYTEVPITRIVNTMLGSSRFGYASAMGIIFGVMLLIISIIQIRLSKKMKRI